jgi:uncharacterized membrane protein YtjA (UPF0391 family)
MALRRWGAMFLMNIFIAAAFGFAYLAYKGAGIARILFYICNSVWDSPRHQIIYFHAQVTSIF